MSIELEDLVGIHSLDAVDDTTTGIANRWGEGMETINCLRFRLDGIIYEAIEDPEDGYRSCMRELVIVEPDTLMYNKFPPCDVMCHFEKPGQYASNHILLMTDIHTGKPVVGIGTDNTDDYYPSYIAWFDPLAMFINADAVREQDAARLEGSDSVFEFAKTGPECTICNDKGCIICMPNCPLCGATPMEGEQPHENFNDGFEYGCGTVVTGPKYGQITSTISCRVNWIANGRTD